MKWTVPVLLPVLLLLAGVLELPTWKDSKDLSLSGRRDVATTAGQFARFGGGIPAVAEARKKRKKGSKGKKSAKTQPNKPGSAADGGHQQVEKEGLTGKKKRARSPAEWASMAEVDWAKVEEDWKAGDHEEELLTEDQIQLQDMEDKRNNPPSPEDYGVDDPVEWIQHSKSTVGPSMMFAVLQATQPNGKPWTQEDTEILGAQWRELLFTGGVDVTCYQIELNKILVTLQRGWESFELKDFLIAQREVEYVEWDSVKYPGEHALPAPDSAGSDTTASPGSATSSKASSKAKKGSQGKKTAKKGTKGKNGKNRKSSGNQKKSKKEKSRKKE